MANQTVTIGNAVIAFAGNNDPSNDGYTPVCCEFYDERHCSIFPLTSYMTRDRLIMIINESSCSHLWKAGRVAGWIEALTENCPQTFRRFRSRGTDVLFIRGVKEKICEELRVRYFPESLCCTRGSVFSMRVK
jgi:hypothetical protein